MRSSAVVACLILVLQLAACSGAPQQDDAEQPAALPPNPAQASPQPFLEALALAIRTEDADELGALFAWDGVDPSQIEQLRLDLSKRFFSCKGLPT